MFNITFDYEYDIVSLTFSNDFMTLDFSPEDSTALLENGFDSGPSNGAFNFSFNDETITFEIAKHGNGKGGRFSLSFNMTKEIKESLDRVILLWRKYLEERNEC